MGITLLENNAINSGGLGAEPPDVMILGLLDINCMFNSYSPLNSIQLAVAALFVA